MITMYDQQQGIRAQRAEYEVKEGEEGVVEVEEEVIFFYPYWRDRGC